MSRSIFFILLLALLLRLPGIPFALPYHVYGDEEANVYGALKMMELKTLLPVNHRAEFDRLLYYPPALAYAYVALFTPVVAYDHFVLHQSIDDIKNRLTLDPSIFWYIARGLGTILALGNIYLLYQISLYFFRNKAIANLAALFLATSFIDVTVSNTVHHWTPGLFFSLLSFYITIKAFESDYRRHTKLLFAGLAMAFSFGISYLVYFLPFLALFIIYRSEHADLKKTLKNLLYFLVPFGILAAIFVAVHPGPFLMQVIHHTAPENGNSKPLLDFLGYYLRTLFQLETPLLLFAAVGFVILFVKRRDAFFIFSLFFTTAAILMYVFLYNIARYLMPVLPFLSLVAGYGLYELANSLFRRRPHFKPYLIWALTVTLLTYNGILYARYTILAMRNDTRVLAKNWVEKKLGAGSTVIDDSERLRFLGTTNSIEQQQELNPEAIRAADRIMLHAPSYAKHPFDLTTLFYATPDQGHELINQALHKATHPAYFVYDSWILDDRYLPLFTTRGKLIYRLLGERTGLGQNSLPTGGDRGQANMNIIEQLYRTDYFGPDVFVYQISS